MFGIQYMKAPPTDYVLFYKGGRVKREGVGLAFFHYAPTSTIVVVPVGSVDVPFVFNETTADYQAVTVQGQLTYRVADARRLASMLDFSVRPDGKYASDDPKKLDERLIHTAQGLTRGAIGRLALREALASAEETGALVLAGLQHAEPVDALGLEVMGFSILSVRPTPEAARALEAEAREALLRRSDEAIYARRNAAVEQERVIKENELNTEIAVETKKRQIRETKIAADIAVEEQRRALIELSVENQKKEADARSYALETTLRPVRDVDWRTLMAVSGGNASDPRMMIGMAFRELAENAQKIGELNISPDLLNSLLTAPAARK